LNQKLITLISFHLLSLLNVLTRLKVLTCFILRRKSNLFVLVLVLDLVPLNYLLHFVEQRLLLLVLNLKQVMNIKSKTMKLVFTNMLDILQRLFLSKYLIEFRQSLMIFLIVCSASNILVIVLGLSLFIILFIIYLILNIMIFGEMVDSINLLRVLHKR